MNIKEKIAFQRFQEECRHYLYEKAALKVLEKRFIMMNRSGQCCVSNTFRDDPLKKYRLLQAHVQHVDRVFADLERKYGENVSRKIKKEMIETKSVENQVEIAEVHQKTILQVLGIHHFAG